MHYFWPGTTVSQIALHFHPLKQLQQAQIFGTWSNSYSLKSNIANIVISATIFITNWKGCKGRSWTPSCHNLQLICADPIVSFITAEKLYFTSSVSIPLKKEILKATAIKLFRFLHNSTDNSEYWYLFFLVI